MKYLGVSGFYLGFGNQVLSRKKRRRAEGFLKEWQRTFQAIFSYPRACFEHTLMKKKITSLCRLKVAALKTAQMWSFALFWPF